MYASCQCLHSNNPEVFIFQVNSSLQGFLCIVFVERFLIFLRVKIKIQNRSPYMVQWSGSTCICGLIWHHASPHSFPTALLFQFLSSAVLAHVLQEAVAKTGVNVQVMLTLAKVKGQEARQEKESLRVAMQVWYLWRKGRGRKSQLPNNYKVSARLIRNSSASFLLKEFYVLQEWACVSTANCA